MNTLLAAQSIYVIGIGGIGTSALSQLLAHEGKQVSGEDMAASPVTAMLERALIDVAFHERGAAFEQADIVIYSSAVPADHPARAQAAERGITQLQYFEALGQYMEQFETVIAVSGTHGKTTSTALIANMLTQAGFDPTAVVGSMVKEFGNSNARVGSADKKYMVVEACEHEAHMLNLRPTMIVVNNIEVDHLDYYRDLAHITETFQEFVNLLPAASANSSAALIVNADDSRASALEYSGTRITLGIDAPADIQAMDIGVEGRTQFFTVANQRYTLQIPGLFNVSNALGAISVAKLLGIPPEIVAESLAAFTGTWRRFEHVGLFRGALVISDYAHHPTEIRKTIQAAREFYPKRRIVVVFQPHQRRRTKELFADFIESLEGADELILQEIYDVAGREDAGVAAHPHSQGGQGESARSLVDALEQRGQFATYTPNAEVSQAALEDLVEPNDVVLIMGAGDIHVLAAAIAS